MLLDVSSLISLGEGKESKVKLSMKGLELAGFSQCYSPCLA